MIFIKDLSDFYATVSLGETAESVTLEFKKVYDERNKGVQEEIRKDFTGMANTLGGTILIGICETQDVRGHQVATSLFGVDVEKTKRKISDVLSQKVFPPISFETFTLSIPNTSDGNRIEILSIVVHPHLNGVGCYETKDGAIKIPYRDEIGIKFYNPSEAIKRMFAAERRIILIAHELEAKGKLVYVVSPAYSISVESDSQWKERLKLEHPNSSYSGAPPSWAQQKKIETRCLKMELQLKELQSTQILFEKSGVEFTVPYGLIREIWKQADGQIHIAFDCDVIVDESDVFLRTS